MEIITASEARSISIKAIEPPDINQLVEEKLTNISENIKKAAKMGKFFLDFEANYLIVSLVKKELVKKGFEVNDGGSTQYIRISWKNEIK